MKKQILIVILSLVLGFLTFPLAADLSQLGGGWHTFFVLPGYGTTDAFNQRCTKDIAKNGHGWVFVKREFFGCNRVNIAISDLIYGEYTHNQTSQELKALEDFQKSRASSDDE